MKKKGTKFERDLIHKLWENGFAAIRTPGSGTVAYPVPDIIAGNGKKYIAIEVKMRSKLPLYIEEQQIKDLAMFSSLFGAECFIGLKLPREDWRFFRIDQLKKTKSKYKIDADIYHLGIDIYELIGRFRQVRLE
ncbi:Holliday junction resolvase - archaeal type [Archaeoglobus sulfaticallidus PM70-1]|uniref:Crossover junction endodeoxyribonuclease Hjc n=1 Tax=Archaeoglobus sulfaticallidus PM70-1 TaxID=387631 RepID=N0BG35_9EURY|nr:Holliday junction resolvase Hjc [Archaeoglobus sulfaticallidus]AGK61262.1 Holliday junction resolvase - archaeal type [Archaeoglobus sulfaticallidus PM70-1]